MTNAIRMFACLALGATLTSCELLYCEDDVAPEALPLEEADMVGAWHITRFVDDDDDYTRHFAGFTYTFEADGRLIVSGDRRTATARWSVTDNYLEVYRFGEVERTFRDRDELEELADEEWVAVEQDGRTLVFREDDDDDDSEVRFVRKSEE